MFGKSARQAFWVRFAPAIGVDGFRLIVRLDVVGLGLEVAVGFLQVVGVRVHGQRGPQDTVTADRRGDIPFLGIQPRMLLVGQEIAGEVFGVFDGRTDQAVVAEPKFEALPI